jgi:uncharacterized SAM-dependent methyltransferase
LERTLKGAAVRSLAADVRYYLSQSPRQLPSRALYDTLGSALFDAICHLPWYPVTRAERRLIDAQRGEIFDAAANPDRLVELGCGNGDKLNLLLGPRGERGHGCPAASISSTCQPPLALRLALRRRRPRPRRRHP